MGNDSLPADRIRICCPERALPIAGRSNICNVLCYKLDLLDHLWLSLWRHRFHCRGIKIEGVFFLAVLEGDDASAGSGVHPRTFEDRPRIEIGGDTIHFPLTLVSEKKLMSARAGVGRG